MPLRNFGTLTREGLLADSKTVGMEEIDAVQLPTMPPYCGRLLPNGEEVEITNHT